MGTITQAVENHIRMKPFLEEALARGIINFSSLAEELCPEIEKEIDKQVTHSSVMMALRRFAKRMGNKFNLAADITFQETDLTIKYDLFEITLERSADIISKVKSLYDIIDFPKGDFLTITHGIYEITMISNRRYRKLIEELFNDVNIVNITDNLASLSLRVPMSAIDMEGLFYIVTKALYWDSINIVEIVSTLTEMTFILRDLDVQRAIPTLRKLISLYR